MPFRWKIFRALCLLQLILSVLMSMAGFLAIFRYGRFYYVIETLAFTLITMYCANLLTILKRNYPDIPVTGQIKRSFNWLFLLNFFLIAFLFSFFFMHLSSIRSGMSQFFIPFNRMPTTLLINFFSSIALIILQLVLLFGAYTLRTEIWQNAKSKQFEFENEPRRS